MRSSAKGPAARIAGQRPGLTTEPFDGAHGPEPVDGARRHGEKGFAINHTPSAICHSEFLMEYDQWPMANHRSLRGERLPSFELHENAAFARREPNSRIGPGKPVQGARSQAPA